MTATAGWLLLRRAEGLWAVRPGELDELGPELPPRLKLRDGTVLLADEILTLAPNLRPHPFPRVAEPFFPVPVHALAVWRSRPVVLIEANAPPPCLRASDSRNSDSQRGGHDEPTR